MEFYHQLWQVVQQVVPGADLEPATLQLDLEQYRSKLLNLFYNKGPDAALRQQVKQGKVQTPNFGEVPLDVDPDQFLVVQLSDKLRLDEVTCVELLTFAQEQRGLSGLEAAFGTYLGGRLDAARSLARLLALQLFHQLEVGDASEAEGDMDGLAAAATDGISSSLARLMQEQPLLDVVVRFNETLLRAESNGRNTLISRLIEVIKDHTLDSLDQSFAVALDQYGCQASKAWYIAQERGELCRSLLYAVVLSPVILKPSTLADLLSLLETLATKAKAQGAAVTHGQLQQSTAVLLAAVAAVSLGNAAGGAPRAPATLAQLLKASELTQHMQRIAKAEDGFSAVVALAVGLTRDALSTSMAGGPHGSLTAGGGSSLSSGFDIASSTLLEAAGKGRALGVLSVLLSSPAFALEPEEGHRHLCARMVYRLLTEMLEFDVANKRELTESLIKASKQHMDKQLSSSRGGSYLPLGPNLVSTLVGPAAVATSGSAAGTAQTPGTPTASQFSLVPVAGAAGAATAGQGGQAGQVQVQQGAAQQDDLSSLLEALAAVFRVRPGLWYDGEAPEAYMHVSSFMSHVAVHAAMKVIPDVQVSFLGVMTSLASGAKGSRFILAQFRANATKPELEHFTWRKLFQSIVGYCRWYEGIEREALMAGGNVMPTGLLNARDNATLMPAGDAALLVAYLDLLGKIISEAAESEIRAELQGLERDVAQQLGGVPLYEPLFQLMCHGVPSALKAAVNRCLSSLARFKELAPRLLERLLMAAVVAAPAPGMLEGYTGLSRFDILTQINEVEARLEEYHETLAFIDFVNALLESLGPTGLPAGGAAIGHYTVLILQYVIGNLWQRAFRDPAQKWQLAAACFKHCQLALAALATCPPITPELLSRPPPGLAVLLSLMGGRQLEKALLQHVLAPGQDELAASMDAGSEGPPRQAAVLEGLRLLNLAMEYDQPAAEQLSTLSVRERLAPLQGMLESPPRRLAVLLQYVLYPDTDIQLEAVKLIAQLAARLPNIVALLQPNFDDTEALLIRQGCAQSLELALLDPSSGESVSSGMAAAAAAKADESAAEDSAARPSDIRAELLLDVMLGSLETAAPPSLGHLLLGFDTTVPPQDWFNQELRPNIDFTCMSVLLRALQATPLQRMKPALYAKCLQLLFAVGATPLTLEPVFRLLMPSESTGMLLPSLAQLLLEPLTVEGADGVHAQVASLRQRAYVLRLYALALLRCRHTDMLQPILAALLLDPSAALAEQQPQSQQNGFAPGPGGFTGQSPLNPYSTPAVLLAIQQICSVTLQEPSLKDIPAELLQLQQDMIVDDISVAMLLTQPAAMEMCNVVTQDDYGQPVFDFAVLQRLLHERFEEYVAKAGGRGGAGEKLARDAVAAAFTHAQKVNAHALIAGAQRAAVLGWNQAIQTAFTKTYALINSKTCPGCGPELLHACLLGTLGLVRELAVRQQAELAETLAITARVLLSKLQELASSSLSLGLPGDPLSQVRLPVRCIALLRVLLDCLLSSKDHKGLRAETYMMLLQYLNFCKGSKLGDCPPLVLASLLVGAGPGTSAAQLDAVQQQLEEQNSLMIRDKANEIVSMMAGDVLQPPERGGTAQAVALNLLTVLVRADTSSTALADVLHRKDIPRGLLHSIAEHAPHILLQPAHKSQAALLVLQAQLTLLLDLAAAGGPAARKGSTKAVADAGALSYLTACRALDYTPEQPSSHQRLKKSGSLRYRLVRLVCPVLRLVIALLSSAPGSSGLAEQAARFTAEHMDLLARLLQEAAAPATAAWSPGDEELEQAALAVSLLARLPGAFSSRGGNAAMTGAGVPAGLRKDLWRLWLVLAGHDRKEGSMVSSIVAQLHTKEAAQGAAHAQQQRRRSLLLQLRCGLAQILRAAVQTSAASPAGALAGTPGLARAVGLSSDLLVCVGHQAQTSVDAMGRPTLLLVRDTADQAIEDTKVATEELEDLLRFLQTQDVHLSNAEVARTLADWGPGLFGLNPTHPTASDANGNGVAQHTGFQDADIGSLSTALVVAGQHPGAAAAAGILALQSAAAAGASGFGGLDPAAARRLARQCAARASAGLLGQLAKQLELVEQCLAIVLHHFVQCLPRPDTAAAMAVAEGDIAGAADSLMLDSSSGTVSDPLLPNPGPEASARLGSISDLQFFAGKMRNVCSQSDDAVSRVRAVLALSGADGGTGGSDRAPVGAEKFMASCDDIELLNRQLKAYLASL